jgi:hypothetical protein
MADQNLLTWTKSIYNGSSVYTSELSAVAAGTDHIASPEITSPGFSGKKVLIGFHTSINFADVVTKVTIEATVDGATWTDIATVFADGNFHSGGAGAAGTTTWAVVDLSDYGDLTNWRINLNGTQGANLGTAGKCKFLYVDGSNEDIAISGIGADPS